MAERTTTQDAAGGDPGPGRPPRLAVVVCAVVEPEVRALAAGAEDRVQIEVLEQGLHNEPERLRGELQALIGRLEAETDCEAIALAYGLCSRGTEGLHTSRVPLVVPRAHDCITLLLGSRERYAAAAADHPGTYWYSHGWIAHTSMPSRERYEECLAHYTEAYGADNAAYLMETLESWMSDYDRAVYVRTGVGDATADEAYTRACAAWLGWNCEVLDGDPGLLGRMLNGDWDERDFAVVPPGHTIRMKADASVMDVVPVDA